MYDELRKLAVAKLVQEKPGQTLQATALVDDAYIRLVDVHRRSTGSPAEQRVNSRNPGSWPSPQVFSALAGSSRGEIREKYWRKVLWRQELT